MLTTLVITMKHYKDFNIWKMLHSFVGQRTVYRVVCGAMVQLFMS